MNSIKDQSLGDSISFRSHLSYVYKMFIEGLPTFQLEPGTSLARAITEKMSSFISNRTIQSISSMLSHTDSNNDSERQSINESDNRKLRKILKKTND